MRKRHELLQRLRAFFDGNSFLEVTTPLLASEAIIVRHIDPFRVTAFQTSQRPDDGPTYYLQTSPELHMKRLLASGATAIYQVTQAFRATELGPLHNPEFTMVEWYRVGDDMTAGINLLGELIQELLHCAPPLVRSYRDVFLEHAGIDPFAIDDDQLHHIAGNMDPRDQWRDRDDLLNLVPDFNWHPLPLTESDNEWLPLVVRDSLRGVDIGFQYPAFFQKLLTNPRLRRLFLSEIERATSAH